MGLLYKKYQSGGKMTNLKNQLKDINKQLSANPPISKRMKLEKRKKMLIAAIEEQEADY